MSSRKYLSGAQKRKLAEKKEDEIKKIAKIDTFFQKKVISTFETPSTSALSEANLHVDDDETETTFCRK